jgi:hypothetical protein
MVAFTKLAALLSSTVVASAAFANVTKLTPKEMLSIVRRGTALPNTDGTLALYKTSQYSFETQKNTYGLWVMNLTSGSSWLYTNSSAAGDTVWLEGNTFTWLVSEDGGTTSMVVGDATTPEAA